MLKHQQVLLKLEHTLDLESTLLAGQCFSWVMQPDKSWSGSCQGRPTTLSLLEDQLLDVRGASREEISSFFTLDLNHDEIRSNLPDDPHLHLSYQSFPGLRLIQDSVWECMGNFICSSLKQVSQISKLNRCLSKEVATSHLIHYPRPEEICSAGEARLRECGLGYRAKFLYRVACEISEGRWHWDNIHQLSTEDAIEHLCQLPGIGPKIANCILLYSFRRFDAFPIDVWMSRILHQLYFSKRKKCPSFDELNTFAKNHFGPWRGHAQLFLFHGFRSGRLSS
ncbi:MAG: DNA glycosylase [Verrucomicrobiota bacterium]